MKPLFLLADSRPLFATPPITDRALDLAGGGNLKAAYLGASNGDESSFYHLFKAAMNKAGIDETMHVHAEPTEDELTYLAAAELILLSGGDTLRGWRAFVASGVSDCLVDRYHQGAVLMGTSAGAIQFGTGAYEASGRWVPMFAWVPRLVAVHEEDTEWAQLQICMARDSEDRIGLGVPSGGTVIYDRNSGDFEACGNPALEMVLADGGLRRLSFLGRQPS